MLLEQKYYDYAVLTVNYYVSIERATLFSQGVIELLLLLGSVDKQSELDVFCLSVY